MADEDIINYFKLIQKKLPQYTEKYIAQKLSKFYKENRGEWQVLLRTIYNQTMRNAAIYGNDIIKSPGQWSTGQSSQHIFVKVKGTTIYIDDKTGYSAGNMGGDRKIYTKTPGYRLLIHEYSEVIAACKTASRYSAEDRLKEIYKLFWLVVERDINNFFNDLFVKAKEELFPKADIHLDIALELNIASLNAGIDTK